MSKEKTETETEQALEMIKAVYDDGVATINDRDYKFLTATHKKRLDVFAFFTKYQNEMQAGNMSCLASPEYGAVIKVIQSVVTFEDSTLNKLVGHWDTYPQDFLPFIQTAMGVICYPFLPGKPTS